MKQVLILGVIFLVVLAQFSWADVPETMSYQGRLTNRDGTAVADGDYKLTFRLYDAATGDTALWSEMQGVEVNSGIFSVILGSITPLSTASLSFATQYWLGIEINGNRGELTPRTQLTSAPYALGGDFWRLNGNAGTTPGTNFLGTTDNQPLELHINGKRVLRFESGIYYGEETANVIAGYNGNSVGTAVGATIAGGGSTDNTNRATASFATVGGGRDNEASNGWAIVCGGLSNTASGQESVVCGGRENVADSMWSTIGGGGYNQITRGAWYATIAGGGSQIPSNGNLVSGRGGTIGGGTLNEVFGGYGTISGGCINQTGTEAGEPEYSYATVAGGYGNKATGLYSVVSGGKANEARGDYSFAAGRRAIVEGNGSFMWADSTDAGFYRTTANRFYVRSSNGVYLYTSGDLSSGVYLSGGGTSWNTMSDKASKRNIRQVNGKEILAKLLQVPISQWSYKTQDSSIEHIGPMAQDFYAAFGLGEDDKHINTIDPDGVALAAIQGLYEMLMDKEDEIAKLKKEKDAQISGLEERLAALEAAISPTGD